jgi:hypothetical protein
MTNIVQFFSFYEYFIPHFLDVKLIVDNFHKMSLLINLRQPQPLEKGNFLYIGTKSSSTFTFLCLPHKEKLQKKSHHLA